MDMSYYLSDKQFSNNLLPQALFLLNYVLQPYNIILNNEDEDDIINGIDAHFDQSRIQIKTLRNRYSSFNTITFEYWQNRNTKEKGEFFKNTDITFCAYADKNNQYIDKYIIVDSYLLKKHITDKKIYETNIRSASTSQASFVFMRWEAIPDSCIIDLGYGVGPQLECDIGQVNRFCNSI